MHQFFVNLWKLNTSQLVWKHSSFGEFQVKKAFEILLKDEANRTSIRNYRWHLVWKVQVPLKICTFVWTLLHGSLPTYFTHKSGGIPFDSSCPLCEGGDESSSHLFLFCPFARAIWYGSSLALHTSDLHSLTVQQWVGICCISTRIWVKTACVFYKLCSLLSGQYGLTETKLSMKESSLLL